MNAKQIFIQRMEEHIQAMQDALERNKSVPDSLFENLPSISPQAAFNTANVAPKPKREEYGKNKKVVLEIFGEAKKALKKMDVATKFSEKTGRTMSDSVRTVTNALSSLHDEHLIRGYKPAGLKFKGQYWTLPEWWDNDVIKLEYEPYGRRLSNVLS